MLTIYDDRWQPETRRPGGAGDILSDSLFHLFSHFRDICILNPLFGNDGSDAFIPFLCSYGLNDIIGDHLHIKHLRTVTGVEYRPFKGFRTINIGNVRITQYTAAFGLAFTRLAGPRLSVAGRELVCQRR